MRPYEALLILPAEADEKLLGTAVDRITKAIEPTGGSVIDIDRWGRRRFAFELRNMTEGYYALVAFDAEPDTIAPLERALTLADEVVRAKVTIRHPKQAPKESSEEARRPRTTAAPAPAAPEPAADADASPETSDEEPSPAPA